MKSRYQVLFSIEVLHAFFASGKWKEITFVPLPETTQRIRESGYQIRQVQNQLLVITPINSSHMPLFLPDFFDTFSFIIQPQSPNYIHFTNLPVLGAETCFHFSNLHGNTSGGVHYLTAPIATYAATTPYLPGDYAQGADGNIYESIAVNNGDQLPDDTLPGSKKFWVRTGDTQFVTRQDTLATEAGKAFPVSCVQSLFYFTASAPATVHQIKVFAYNSITKLYDKHVLSQRLTFAEPHTSLQVDMRPLASGKYKVLVNNDIRFVYLVPAASMGAMPMLVDIFHLPKTEALSFLNTDGTLKKIKYTLHFGSRRVYWRFKTRTTDINQINDTSGEYTFVPDGLRQYISTTPIPLTDKPRKTLSGNAGNLVISSPLPNPRIDRLLDKRDEIFTTETFINF